MEYSFNKELFQKARKKKKLSYAQIAQILTDRGQPITVDGVTYWFRSENNKPEIEKIEILAEILEEPFNKLAIIKDEIKNKIIGEYSSVKLVPVVGTASCGIPDINSLQEYEEKVPCADDFWNKNVYAVIANGDSMLPEFKEGDIIYCDPTADVLDGDFVHYQYHNETAIKFYREDKKMGMIYFVPLNPSEEFKTLRFRVDDEECQYLTIVKVVGHHRSLLNNRQERIRMYGIGNLN